MMDDIDKTSLLHLRANHKHKNRSEREESKVSSVLFFCLFFFFFVEHKSETFLFLVLDCKL